MKCLQCKRQRYGLLMDVGTTDIGDTSPSVFRAIV